MIEDEIYGMMVRAKIVIRPKAPPENMLNIPMMPPACRLKMSSRITGSIPGSGI